MNEGNVRKWCHSFKGGRTNVHNKVRFGCPSVITEDLKSRVEAHIFGGFTVDQPREVFPYVSQCI
jgi:hypothetical protein